MFSDIQIQKSLNDESKQFGDIVQANYTDSYFNNTYKTMSGIYWVMKYCPNAKFYMFVDDDYYVSTKNVLRFIKFPTHYPDYLKEPLSNIRSLINRRKTLEVLDFELDNTVRLYAGYGFNSSPLRHYFSKWYISLNEYPYHKWPPYITGGAMILSNAALKDLFYQSLYTQHFKFDDIYISIVAYKAKLEAFHSEYFYAYKRPYYRLNYQYTIASHGFDDPQELVRVWSEQKSLGNA
ncbi:hypothetical protein GWI33_013268 [Rhynchophorus ferrugineus]|uniref:Hexosyltransferase n=1 Tax=Rhynchophorus ferrugineus TaxID=354439 RepID=A0A834M807_RHYFE|nr:hypothetical protein GWI33_013268 [Rhynchophorus ferrugineus]